MSQNMAKRTWGAWQKRMRWSELVMNGRWMHCSSLETDADSLCGSEFQQCQFLLEKSMNSLMPHMDRAGRWRCILAPWEWTGNAFYFWKMLFISFSEYMFKPCWLWFLYWPECCYTRVLIKSHSILVFLVIEDPFYFFSLARFQTTAQFSYIADPILIDLHLYKVLL